MNEFKDELVNNILPFWINKMQDFEYGGFYGRIDGNNKVHLTANKGAILNARILWTFSAAYRILKNPEYKEIANRAFNYIKDFFIDKSNGGVYWELDYKGKPVNTKKQTYAQGFALYGFSEFYRATGNTEALELAKEFFYIIEKNKDKESGGYYEAFTQDWKSIDDMRLSEKDANEKKSMNTHLHILEPYTNLCRIWDNELLKNAQKELIEIFIKHIVDEKSSHLQLFFDETWAVKSNTISYGHDIESSWLLYEAADVLKDDSILDRIKKISLKIAIASTEGIQSDGSLIYEREGEKVDLDRHWWVQAEAVVGYLYAYKISENIAFIEIALKTWAYIQKFMIDLKKGEWFWGVEPSGIVNEIDDKAGFWKCPYHNGRMCLEMIENLN